jgi:putative DNA primase/helicase
MLNAALSYAARGWRVHPLKPRDKTPISKNGCKDATADAEQIRKWWAKFPDANIGLATGYEFFALDIDPAGMAWYEANDLPTTHEAVTGRGGRHLLYRMPSGAVIKNSANRIAPGVDIRGIGGYICAAPSLHPNGTPYSWLDCEGDAPEGPCAEAPLWLVDMAVKLADADGQRFNLPAQIVEGGRDNALYKFAASMRAHSFEHAEIRSALDAANARCSPPLPSADLDRITRSVCTKAPGKSPQFQQRQILSPMPVEPVVHEAEFVEEEEIETHAKLVPNALADRILQKHAIINSDGYIYEYTGRYWELISPERLKALAAQYDGKFNTTQKRRSEIADYIRTQTHAKNQKWRDLEPYEVPVGNGVVDIRSMTLRPHRKADMIQACCPVEFDPRAECVELMCCLATYFGGDADGDAKVAALQEFFGYCLMPHARYKKALLCVGESDCGKSTIPFLIRELVGRMNVCSVSVEDMDDSRARAPLLGKLVNLLTELTSDAMIADGGFKTLVSTEEPIQFDPKYLPPVMDIPVCKHVIVTNTLPTINDRSRGTYNRLLIVRFNHVIPRSEQDRGIWDKLGEELPGILQWALEGAQRLFHAGGTFTAAGEVEVEEYRARQDPVAAFVLDECEVDTELKVAMPDLRQRYSQWFGKPVDPRRFADLIRGAGYEVTDNPIWFGGKKHRAVIGLGLR